MSVLSSVLMFVGIFYAVLIVPWIIYAIIYSCRCRRANSAANTNRDANDSSETRAGKSKLTPTKRIQVQSSAAQVESPVLSRAASLESQSGAAADAADHAAAAAAVAAAARMPVPAIPTTAKSISILPLNTPSNLSVSFEAQLGAGLDKLTQYAPACRSSPTTSRSPSRERSQFLGAEFILAELLNDVTSTGSSKRKRRQGSSTSAVSRPRRHGRSTSRSTSARESRADFTDSDDSDDAEIRALEAYFKSDITAVRIPKQVTPPPASLFDAAPLSTDFPTSPSAIPLSPFPASHGRAPSSELHSRVTVLPSAPPTPSEAMMQHANAFERGMDAMMLRNNSTNSMLIISPPPPPSPPPPVAVQLAVAKPSIPQQIQLAASVSSPTSPSLLLAPPTAGRRSHRSSPSSGGSSSGSSAGSSPSTSSLRALATGAWNSFSPSPMNTPRTLRV